MERTWEVETESTGHFGPKWLTTKTFSDKWAVRDQHKGQWQRQSYGALANSTICLQQVYGNYKIDVNCKFEAMQC